MKLNFKTSVIKIHTKRCFSYLRSNEQNNTDICIVGAGPTGMFLSILLSKYGVYHTLIDRKLKPTDHPQAHFINARSMEMLRDTLKPTTYKNLLEESPSSEEWRYSKDFITNNFLMIIFNYLCCILHSCILVNLLETFVIVTL